MKPRIEPMMGKIRPSEGDELQALAAAQSEDERLRELPVVEIGSYMGRSTIYLARGGAHVYAVDMWDLHERALDEARTNLKRKVPYHLRETFEAFLSNIKAADVAGQVTWVKAPSGEVAKVWSRPIGGLFIDGAHDERSVRVDYEGWAGHVAVGGWIAFHDRGSRGVRPVIAEAEASPWWTDWRYVERLAVATRGPFDGGERP